MDKGIRFNRTIYRTWLDATAAFCAETDDPAEIRKRLEAVVGQDLEGVEARRKTIDILLNIWFNSQETAPDLRDQAVSWFQATTVPGDRLWLHYGLTMVYYPFFRECLIVIGRSSRLGEAITTRLVKLQLVGELGQLGSLKRSAERVVSSLRNWGVLVDSEQRNVYAAPQRVFVASDMGLEKWMLACALLAHPSEELPFADLVRLPELFPFRFALAADHLRADPRFVVQRQGAGWETVRRASTNEVNPR